MEPTIGRIVHYVPEYNHTGEPEQSCFAAIITHVDTRDIWLTIFRPIGLEFQIEVTHDESKSKGTWHWPERTE